MIPGPAGRPYQGGIAMDDSVRTYIDAVDPAYRPMFDRVHTECTG